VNNSTARNEDRFDFTGCFQFLTAFPPARSGEQAVHINSLKEKKNKL
jgi:hypothetical protein